MVFQRVWPLVLVMCFASFLTNTIAWAWGPMPPVVEKQSVANVPISICMTLHGLVVLFHFLSSWSAYISTGVSKTLLVGASSGCETHTSKNARSMGE